MSEIDVTEWLANEISCGGKLVLLDTYADHVVIAVARADKVMLSLTNFVSNCCAISVPR